MRGRFAFGKQARQCHVTCQFDVGQRKPAERQFRTGWGESPRTFDAVGALPLTRHGESEAAYGETAYGSAVVFCDQNIRRLEVAMDDTFLMRVLYGMTDLREQLQPLVNR